jgi:hypothetical protein
MTADFLPEKLILATIEAAEEFSEAINSSSDSTKPRLLIEDCSPDLTVASMRDILARDPELFDRGGPVRLVSDPTQNNHTAHSTSPDGLVLKIHGVSRPYKLKTNSKGEVSEVDARLPRAFAVMYLDWRGNWGLRPLNGIASVPLLRKDGSIFSKEGYDPISGMWLENMPDVSNLVPRQPTCQDAEVALWTLRDAFKTFCFADAATVIDTTTGTMVVDISKPPGHDESAFLHALLTAVARPSLHLAPGVIIRAASTSGAGAGKGLLARCICALAFGHDPYAVTGGGTPDEIEKRIAAELMGGSSTLFLDNLNNTSLKSELLASAITERPARVRLLGKSEMVKLNSSALVILTGNGLSVSEDLARRFLTIDLDPRTENPEARSFAEDIRETVMRRRKDLLASGLTIWRWGRQSQGMSQGRPLGSFDQWCNWVRDPLLALGCQDPAERVGEAKERDGRRQAIGELFGVWWLHHSDQALPASKLHEEVKRMLDPQSRNRQYLSSSLEKLANTRMAGFVLTRQAAASNWGVATYALNLTGEGEGHRGHRDHRGHPHDTNPDVKVEDEPRTEPPCPKPTDQPPMGPMVPMPLPATEETVEPPLKRFAWSQRI